MRQCYTEEAASKVFSAKSRKEAYLNACKWLATNIIGNEEFENIQYRIEKDKNLPMVTLRLFVCIEENRLKKEHCEACREAHKLFYMNDVNCQTCTIAGYQNRSRSILNVKCAYIRTKFKEQGLIEPRTRGEKE